MPCHSPLTAVQHRESGKVLLGQQLSPLFNDYWAGKKTRDDVNYRPLLLPCGTCLGCRTSQARAWALRGMLELHDHESATFTTLTYDKEHVPPTLSKRALQLFIKRVRRDRPPKSVKHLSCGEYGEENGRPHYHSILYGVDAVKDKGLVESSWPNGNVQVVKCTPWRIAYTAGYTTKKVADRFGSEKHERIDYDTGESYEWQPSFRLMSLKPGIGSSARQYINSWRNFAILNGIKMPVPRYLHLAWKTAATPEQLAELEREKQELHDLHQITFERIHAQKLIDTAQQQLKASRRKL